MNRRLARWLLVLYPRAWRDRYGAEVADLNEDLIAAGETTPLHAGLNLIAGAAGVRARMLIGSRHALAASAVALMLAMGGVAFGGPRAGQAPQAAGNWVSVPCAVPRQLPSRSLARPDNPPRGKPGRASRCALPAAGSRGLAGRPCPFRGSPARSGQSRQAAVGCPPRDGNFSSGPRSVPGAGGGRRAGRG